ncbi:MAG: Gfo/Idh/MocA family oxidoreductase [Ruminococcaceae bacterium]|nr:Gfo/Idh/MocA family oxidoreductase [Oscillospiraceae bacterium]
METVRYGIIGLGNQGSSYLLNFFDKGLIKNSEVTALCDIAPEKIESIKKKTLNKMAAYFTDYKEMLDSGLCDAILVEVPHYLHPEMVMECLKRNINVICEKPAGVYTKQVKEMNAFAENSKARFAMMFNQRTNCLYRKMRELIANGEIGELQRVTWIITDWYRTQQYYDSGSWRATWEGEGGGVLINQCPHQIDLVQWVVGKMPKYVRGFCQYGKWHDIEVEDEVTAFFEYDNGATGMFITTTGETPGTNRFEVSGTLGKLLCEKGKLWLYKNETDSQEFIKTSEKSFNRPKSTVTEVETDGINPQHVGIINNFTESILEDKECFAEGKDGLAGVELMNAIELSGWYGGERVSLPVDEDEYLRELNKRRSTSRLKTSVKETVSDTAGTYGSV